METILLQQNKATYKQPIANMILKSKDKDACSHHFFSI